MKLVWSFLFIGVGLNAAAQLLLKGATRIAGPLVSDAGRIEWPNATALLQTLPLSGWPCVLWRKPAHVARCAFATPGERRLSDAFLWYTSSTPLPPLSSMARR